MQTTPFHRSIPRSRYRTLYGLAAAAALYFAVSTAVSIRSTVSGLCASSNSATLKRSPSIWFHSSATGHVVDGCVKIPENGRPMAPRTNIPERLENVYLKLDEYLDEHAPLKEGRWKDQRPEGVAADHLGGHKVNFLWDAVKRHVPQCQTVCEVGLNAGHSSVLWLEACPGAKAILFDLPYKKWSQATFEFLRKHYDGRITITEGNSLTTVPDYLHAHPDTKCDIIAIDGSKEAAVRFQDFLNLEQFAHHATLLLLDDASIERIQARLATMNETRGSNDFIGSLRMASHDLNGLYASLLNSNYIRFQGGCSLPGARLDRENSTISAFYTRFEV